jgi:hypothetical protein
MGKTANLVKRISLIGISAFFIYAMTEPLVSQKIDEKRFGKEYTSFKQAISLNFLSDLDSLKRDYIMEADGVDKKSFYFQSLKNDYQEKETFLTKKYLNDLENLEDSLRR